MVMGEMDFAWAKLKPCLGGSQPVRKAAGMRLSGPGGRQLPGGWGGGGGRRRLESAYPVDEIHQARIKWGVGDGDNLWRGQKEGSVDSRGFSEKLLLYKGLHALSFRQH